ALTTGENSDALLLVLALEVEARHVRARVERADIGRRTERERLGTLRDLVEDRLLIVERVARLVDVAELDGLADLDRALVRLLDGHDHAEQRRLAGTVGTDDTDDATARQLERQVVDEQAIAERLAHAVEHDDLATETRSRRDHDLERGIALLLLGFRHH